MDRLLVSAMVCELTHLQGDGGVGIVVCDWVGKDGDWDLVRCIVGMNSRLLLREKGIGWK